MTKLYVYAFVDGPARAMRISDRQIQFLPLGELHAAIEERASAPEMTEAALRQQHELVVVLANRFDAIIPVRFGALVDNDELARIVALRHHVLRDALETVRGREQMTTRCFAAAGTTNVAAERPKDGRSYLVARAPEVSLPRIALSACLAVKHLACEQRVERGRGSAATVLHHLIPRGRSSEYTAALRRAAVESTAGEEIRVSGPFPPFAFAPDLWR